MYWRISNILDYNWGILHNVCLSRKVTEERNAYVIFYGTDYFQDGITVNDYLGMKYSINPIEYPNKTFPYNEIIMTKNVWMIRSQVSFSIGHFTDNFSLLWYIAKHSKEFPPIDYILLPGVFTDGELFWNEMTLEIYLNELPHRPVVYTTDDFMYMTRKGLLMCFDTLNIIGEAHFGGYGGYFESVKMKHLFRDRTFEYLELKPQINKNIINILIVIRDSPFYPRNIINIKPDLISLINSICDNLCEIKYAIFESLLPEEQIEIVMNSDIYITPHGSSIMNHLWLNDNGILIECFPFYFIDTDSMIPTLNSNYLYLSSHSTKALKDDPVDLMFSKICNSDVNTLSYRVFHMFQCRSSFLIPNIIANLNFMKFNIFYSIKYSLFKNNNNL